LIAIFRGHFTFFGLSKLLVMIFIVGLWSR